MHKHSVRAHVPLTHRAGAPNGARIAAVTKAAQATRAARRADRAIRDRYLALLVPKDDYLHRHPQPDDVLLLVEVSDTTLRFDRTVKLPLYASAGIPEVWIVAMEHDALHVYRRPSGRAYEETRTLGRGDTVEVAALASFGTFSVDDLLGPAPQA